MTFRAFLRGCWPFGHSYTLEMRGKVGVQVCQDCRQVKTWPKTKKAYKDKSKSKVTTFPQRKIS